MSFFLLRQNNSSKKVKMCVLLIKRNLRPFGIIPITHGYLRVPAPKQNFIWLVQGSTQKEYLSFKILAGKV